MLFFTSKTIVRQHESEARFLIVTYYVNPISFIRDRDDLNLQKKEKPSREGMKFEKPKTREFTRKIQIKIVGKAHFYVFIYKIM